MFWTITAILLIFWLLGYIGQVGGGFIHLLLFVSDRRDLPPDHSSATGVSRAL